MHSVNSSRRRWILLIALGILLAWPSTNSASAPTPSGPSAITAAASFARTSGISPESSTAEQQQEVRVQSGPSNAVTIIAARMDWRQTAPDAATLATYRYTAYVDGKPFADLTATCTPTTGPSDLNCSAPLPPNVPDGAVVTIETYIVVPPPPPPASLRVVIGGSGGGS